MQSWLIRWTLEPVRFGVFAAITAVLAFTALIISAVYCRWDLFAIFRVGLLTAGVVAWQGSLIKSQIALQAILDLEREWNSPEMFEYREHIREPDGAWNVSNLEAALEFFEKLASFNIAGLLSMDLVCASTLGWYAAHYYLFARDEIQRLRDDVWKDYVYGDLEKLYEEYVTREVGSNPQARKTWEAKRKETEATFWAQEREG